MLSSKWWLLHQARQRLCIGYANTVIALRGGYDRLSRRKWALRALDALQQFQADSWI
jgi:hypothetical protein